VYEPSLLERVSALFEKNESLVALISYCSPEDTFKSSSKPKLFHISGKIIPKEKLPKI
jgi:hypothetical protein